MRSEDSDLLPHGSATSDGHDLGGDSGTRLAIVLDPSLDAELAPSSMTVGGEQMRGGHGERSSIFMIAELTGASNSVAGRAIDAVLEQDAIQLDLQSQAQTRGEVESRDSIWETQEMPFGPTIVGCILVAMIASRAGGDESCRTQSTAAGSALRRWWHRLLRYLGRTCPSRGRPNPATVATRHSRSRSSIAGAVPRA